MRCPDDDTLLQPTRRAGLPLDVCPLCHGLWFDTDEIRPFTQHHGARNPRVRPLHLASSLTQAALQKRPCPACPGTLSPLVVQDVPVARCHSCRGVFLSGLVLAALTPEPSEAHTPRTPPSTLSIVEGGFDLLEFAAEVLDIFM